MTTEERQAILDKSVAKYAVIGVLKNGKGFDCCLCVSDLDFKKELEKFSIYRTYRLVEIHKR